MTSLILRDYCKPFLIRISRLKPYLIKSEFIFGSLPHKKGIGRSSFHLCRIKMELQLLFPRAESTPAIQVFCAQNWLQRLSFSLKIEDNPWQRLLPLPEESAKASSTITSVSSEETLLEICDFPWSLQANECQPSEEQPYDCLLPSSPYSLHHQDPLLTLSHPSVNSFCLLILQPNQVPSRFTASYTNTGTKDCSLSANLCRVAWRHLEAAAFGKSGQGDQNFQRAKHVSLVLVSSMEKINPTPKPELFCSLRGLQSRASVSKWLDVFSICPLSTILP